MLAAALLCGGAPWWALSGPSFGVGPAAWQAAQDAELAASIRAETKASISPWFLEAFKLAQAGIEPGVILAFIDSAGTFNLTTEQVIFAHREGFPGELIAAMMRHDADLNAGLLPMPSPPPRPPMPGPVPARVATPAAAIPSGSSPGTARQDDMELADGWMDLVALPPECEREPVRFPVRHPYVRLMAAHPSYPVREAQPVRITAPIMVMTGAWKRPNVQIVTLPPESDAP